MRLHAVATPFRTTSTPSTPEHRPGEIGRPQPAVTALARAGLIRGRVLDVGCGTGEHVLLCAGLGLDVTGVDIADIALRSARRKADERGLAARFLRHDARCLDELGEVFDTVLDCLVFHAFPVAVRGAYLDGVRSVLRPRGQLIMLCYSDQQPDDRIPHRLGRDEIVDAFSPTGGGSTRSTPHRPTLPSTRPGSRRGSPPPPDSDPGPPPAHSGGTHGMPTADGVAATPRAARYLVQLCRHAGRMQSHPLRGRHDHRAGSPAIDHVEWSDTEGVLRLDDGVCTLRATPDALLLHVDATDGPALRRIQHLLSARLEGFGRRDGLRVEWQPPLDPSPNQGATATPTTDANNGTQDTEATDATAVIAGDPTAGGKRWRAPTAAVVLVVALAVAVHVGLLGGLLTAPQWAAGAVELVVAVIAVKVLAVVILGLRRRRTRRRLHGRPLHRS